MRRNMNCSRPSGCKHATKSKTREFYCSCSSSTSPVMVLTFLNRLVSFRSRLYLNVKNSFNMCSRILSLIYYSTIKCRFKWVTAALTVSPEWLADPIIIIDSGHFKITSKMSIKACVIILPCSRGRVLMVQQTPPHLCSRASWCFISWNALSTFIHTKEGTLCVVHRSAFCL